MRTFVASCLLFSATAAFAGEVQLGHPEMKAMFVADQEARQGEVDDWEVVAKADAARRIRVRELLDAGELTTGHDFYAAAFIFQHGMEPDDYLLAHALAVRSLGLGMKEAEWIAAAALDRYLQNIGQSQIYGTQFLFPTDDVVTMEPYNRSLLPGTLREAAGAGSDAEQSERLDRYQAELTSQPDG